VKLAVVLDPLERLDPTGDTSLALVEAAQGLGHESFIVETQQLTIVDGQLSAPLRRIHLAKGHMDGPRWVAPEPWCEIEGPRGLVPLASMDAVLFRTDPPVDRLYLWASYLLDAIDATRTVLVNDPRGVRQANEKLFPLRFPDLVPPTLVTADQALIRGFVDEYGRAVAKPIDGHAGRGVLRLEIDDPNVPSIVEVMTARGSQPIVVQAWLEEADGGNKRILVYDGEVLGAVNRPREPRDFRTGSPSAAACVTDREREIVARLKPALHRLGLRLVGLDVIGDYLIEVNVTSPGGIRQAEGLGLTGMARTVIERIEAERSTRT
jgi:glutathione synthase